MLVVKGRVKSDDALAIHSLNADDVFELSVPLIVVRRRNHQLIANFPVNLLDYSQFSVTRLHGCVQISPRHFLPTMNVESTI